MSWVEVSGMNIQSDRAATPAENLCVYVIDKSNDNMLEKNLFRPTADEDGEYKWPALLAKQVNANSKYIRAGEKSGDDTFTPQYSSYLNKVYERSGDAGAHIVFPTSCKLDCWVDAGNLGSTGSVPAGMQVNVTTSSAKYKVVYECLGNTLTAATNGQYMWPSVVAKSLNNNSMTVRAGEKNTTTKLITPLQSGYRNRLWVPLGSNFTVAVSFEATSALVSDAEKVYAAALATQTSASVVSKATIDGWLSGFSGGKFGDISYPSSSSAGSNTDPLYLHLNHVRDIGNYAYHNNLSESDTYFQRALSALEFYCDQRYTTANWWDRQVGLAKLVAQSIVLLANKTSSNAIIIKAVAYLDSTTNINMGETGANQADFAYSQLLGSIGGWKNSRDAELLNKTYTASEAVSQLCFPVARHGPEYGEGISVDYSFSQHNPRNGLYSQLQAGSYGAVLIGDIFALMPLLIGAFAISADAIASIEKYFIKGLGWFMRNALYDFQVLGRSISRGMNGTGGPVGWATKLLAQNPSYPNIIQELVYRAKGDESKTSYYLGSRAFWVNDYLAHLYPTFGVWCKTISTRTVGSENGNGENLKGYYMGCGSHFVFKHGTEYTNIQPTWDWLRLPGTTVEQNPSFVFPEIKWGANDWGSDAFTGAIANGSLGANAMILTREKVKNAKKTAVTLADKAVFLGSSIDTSSASHTVYTSVNQCHHRGDIVVYYADGSKESVPTGGKVTSRTIVKVVHDGLSYAFPESGQTVTVQSASQSGSWYEINTTKNGSVATDVFSLWIEHGKSASEAYYYEITDADKASSAPASAAVHSSNVHAVTMADKKSGVAVIFSASSGETQLVLDAVTIKASAPIAYIATQSSSSSIQLTIADLSQKLSTVAFEFNWNGTARSASFKLPDGDDAGKSTTWTVTSGGSTTENAEQYPAVSASRAARLARL